MYQPTGKTPSSPDGHLNGEFHLDPDQLKLFKSGLSHPHSTNWELYDGRCTLPSNLHRVINISKQFKQCTMKALKNTITPKGTFVFTSEQLVEIKSSGLMFKKIYIYFLF